MANSQPQPLGAGDGLANAVDPYWNTSSPSVWTNMPIPVFAVLGSKMDGKGLCDMRLVCTDWLKNIEEYVALKLKNVDDRVEGNLDFVRRVKVGSACVRNWTVDIGAEPATLLFHSPGWLKKLKLCGKMPSQWKIHNLSQFTSLTHLVLRDSALYSNNITDPQYPEINFDLTSPFSPDDLMKQAYQTQDPPSKSQPIELKNLRTLEIIRYRDDHVELPTHSYLVMSANICFLLCHVTSPVLSVVNVTVRQSYKFSRTLRKKLNWRLEPLHRLLNNHRATLRQVFLECAKYPDLIEDESLSDSFPESLRKLHLEIRGPVHRHSQDPPTQSTFPYLLKVLQGQTQLEEVEFEFYSFPLKWTTDAFTCLANSCSRTLRHLELRGLPYYDNPTSLDLEILSACQSLEVLHLMNYCILWGQTGMQFRNVDKMPSSLKRLVIRCCSVGDKVEIGEPGFFKRLAVLEWVCLDNIHLQDATNVEDQEPMYNFCRTMIKTLLGLRKLQGFQVKVLDLMLNTDQSLVAMLTPLSPDFSKASRFPNRANFNLTHPSYLNIPHPWSDKPFDRCSWELEKYQDD